MRVLIILLSILSLATAQFGNMFEQMFHGHQQQHQPQNVGSDSSWYRQNYNAARCEGKYLCPATLSCVDKPTHCPCAFPDVEEKFEVADGLAVCISKSGFKVSEAAKKIELARKGLL